MKYLKNFENTKKNNYKVGDYIIVEYSCDSRDDILMKLKGFIDNTIGVLYSIDKYENGKIFVKYDNVPDGFIQFFNSVYDGYTKPFHLSQIVEYSDKKEDLEYLINANKFNI